MSVADLQPLRSGFVAGAGGRIWWELHGTGDRETVCLLNGLAMHTRAWWPFVGDLDGYDVLLYDYPGQGASDDPAGALAIADLARALSAILDELGIERVHSVGVSYGGFVAAELARIAAPRLLTQTLSGILLSHERTFELYQDVSLRFYAGGPALFPLYTRYMYEKIFGERFLRATPPATLDAMRERFAERYAGRIGSLVRLTEAQTPFFAALDDRLPEYRAVAVPTLVLAGAEDRVIPPRAQAELAEIFPHSRFELVPESGHVVYLERRDLFFPRLRAFLRSRDPRAERA